MLHQADADRVSRELQQPPSAFLHTGARPKSTPVSAPRAPTPEQITVTEAQSHKGTSATSSTSSSKSRDVEQDLQDHTRDLIQDLDGMTEHEKLDTDNGLKIITRIADLKKRAKRCMPPNKVASISAHLQHLVDEAWQAQRTETEPSMFNIRVAAAVLTLAETDVRQAEKAHRKKKNSCLLYTSPSPRD